MSNTWKWDYTYPVRCRIVDAAGQTVMHDAHGLGIVANTPAVSEPHIGKEGTAYKDGPLHVRIELDDGSKILGSECWWEPIGPVEFAA